MYKRDSGAKKYDKYSLWGKIAQVELSVFFSQSIFFLISCSHIILVSLFAVDLRVPDLFFYSAFLPSLSYIIHFYRRPLKRQTSFAYKKSEQYILEGICTDVDCVFACAIHIYFIHLQIINFIHIWKKKSQLLQYKICSLFNFINCDQVPTLLLNWYAWGSVFSPYNSSTFRPFICFVGK